MATPWLGTARWADAVHALAPRTDPAGHAPLAAFAAVAGEAERQTLAAALVRTALPADAPLLASLATDASLRTRVAAAAATHRLGGGATP